MSRASWPKACRALTRVLSCMQEPQYMPAAPAVIYAIFIPGPAGSLPERGLVRLGQEEGRREADQENEERHPRRRVGHPRGVVAAGDEAESRHHTREGGKRGANHPAADVRRHALARA